MKKAMILLLLLVVVLPSQAFAATYSNAYVDKYYFESYKDRVKEVKDAQKNLSKVLGTEVTALAQKSKVSAANYSNAVKNKLSKEAVAKARNEMTQDKKTLAAAKAKLSKTVKSAKKESDTSLKEIANHKASLVKMIKTHLEGKDQQSDAAFNKTLSSELSQIDSSFNAALEYLQNIELD
ncbi:hypothetical protein H70357_06360 [Paenibacillus sp. FSL H7-0357]|uniref:hypothetical protein n=1 Tax=Paenibacillus sp. FSL H7-0357 TaxID=1536774 RepID=UPI0004F62DE1|nr:hypothetical protein [Paenibacillus sp. FSL H7-0357]AIQ16345.1 hypothetical protein H70357_06360 [Paenibacillus sp. FSL H7-0357]